MIESCPNVRLVLTTATNPEEAGRLGRVLVEERLAACVTLLPGVESIYRWKGEVETASETMLLVKTEAALLEALEARLMALHSYETPEFLVVDVESASKGYLGWLQSSLQRAGEPEISVGTGGVESAAGELNPI